MNILELKNISKRFNTHQALDKVSIKIPEQSIFGLLGHNGAGKTTLIRIITRILMADNGDIIFKGEELNAQHIRRIGYLPEERGLYKKMRVKEHLLYLAQLKDIPKNVASINIDEWLEKFNLIARAKAEIGTLSKGMQQKVQFIATVMNKPELIILDEPFSGFDPVNIEIIKSEILRLNANGATVLYSTHQMKSVEDICDRMAIINQSKLVLEGTIENLKNEYNDNKFEIVYEGILPDSKMYTTLSTRKKGNIMHATLKLNDEFNNVLRFLVEEAHLRSFHELRPTVEELFFKFVKS